MERLTKIIKCPDGTNIYDFSEKVVKKYITDHKGGVRALFEKLAQYEDTGLAPEQIQEIDRLYKEKCREAAEKQRAKKVVIEGYSYSIGTRIGSCPVCGNVPLRESGCDYCPKCGQKLDWSVEE